MNTEKNTIQDEIDNYVRRDSNLLVTEAIIQKKSELDKYKSVIKLYGQPPSPLLQSNNPQLPQDQDFQLVNESKNKILENKHNLNIENKILNIFIILFTILILFQFSLISILKLDIDWPTFNIIDYELVFKYAYLVILLFGKSITYVFMITFFIRLYIGLKVFGSSVNTNILLKLINIQFMGFLNSSLMAIGILSLDVLFKLLLKRLELIPDDFELDDDESKFNLILKSILDWFNYFDVILYSTIFIGLVLSGLRKIVRLTMNRRSVRME